MKTESIQLTKDGEPVEMDHYPLSIPGYQVSLLATDTENEYFYLVLIPRNITDPQQVIQIGGPFAAEEFNVNFE